MKTNYEEALLFIADDVQVTHLAVDRDFDESCEYSVRFNDCQIFENEEYFSKGHSYGIVMGYGISLEEACADYFQKIAGKILLFETKSSTKHLKVKYSMDDEMKKYKTWKEKEFESNLNYEDYLDILDKNRKKPYTVASQITKIATKNIKGRTLYGITIEGFSATCLLYDNCCSYIKRAQKGDTVQLAFLDSDPSLKEKIVVNCRVTLKEREERKKY